MIKKHLRVALPLTAALFFFCSSLPAGLAAGGHSLLDSVSAAGADVKVLKSLPPPTAAAAAEGAARAIEPGTGLAPVVRDDVRVKAILQLVSDIYHGKELPFSQDGVTFLNKEGLLPQQPKGYYKEYTLLTGNAPHTVTIGDKTYQVSPDMGARGSERVVIGNGEKLYYTPDHYRTFILLNVVR